GNKTNGYFRVGIIRRRVLLLYRVAQIAGGRVIFVVRTDDAPNQLVADDVAGAKVGKVHVVDVIEDLAHQAQSGNLALGQVHLRDIAGDDDFGTKAQTRQKHLHLRCSGVLGFVEDDEGIVERAAAHIRQGGYFDDAGFH